MFWCFNLLFCNFSRKKERKNEERKMGEETDKRINKQRKKERKKEKPNNLNIGNFSCLPATQQHIIATKASVFAQKLMLILVGQKQTLQIDHSLS